MKSIKALFLSLIAVSLLCGSVYGDNIPESNKRNYFVGTSAFMLYNFSDESPDFYQLFLGRWLTDRDVLSIQFTTWKYRAPLGIPYGPSFDNEDDYYPGSVREFGIGAGYQRYLWKGLYAGISALPLYQIYLDEDGDKIQNGFQLFCTARVGYNFSLFDDRFYIEPSIAVTFWPINTNVPPEFKEEEDRWPSYFLAEPGLRLGYKFDL